MTRGRAARRPQIHLKEGPQRPHRYLDVDIDIDTDIDVHRIVDFKKLEHGCRMIYAGCPSFFGLGFGLEDGHAPAFWLLLFGSAKG